MLLFHLMMIHILLNQEAQLLELAKKFKLVILLIIICQIIRPDLKATGELIEKKKMQKQLQL